MKRRDTTSKKFDVVYENPNNIPPMCCSIFGGIFAWSDLGKMPLKEMPLYFHLTLPISEDLDNFSGYKCELSLSATA